MGAYNRYRANCIQNWYSENNKEAFNDLVILMDCIRDNFIDEMPDKQVQLESYKESHSSAL